MGFGGTRGKGPVRLGRQGNRQPLSRPGSRSAEFRSPGAGMGQRVRSRELVVEARPRRLSGLRRSWQAQGPAPRAAVWEAGIADYF